MPMDMNKTVAEASLDNLHDIIVPEAVGVFPLSPGWYILFILCISILFHFAYKYVKRYKKTLYKREALLELEQITSAEKEDSIGLLSLSKRVAIHVYGRREIAKLSGDSWWDFMQEHSTVKVEQALRQKLEVSLYKDGTTLSHADFNTVADIVKEWIVTHKVAKDV